MSEAETPPGGRPPVDDDHVSIRLSRPLVAFVGAIAVHLTVFGLQSLVPIPKAVPRPMELTLVSPPKSLPAPSQSPSEPRSASPKTRRKSSPPPSTSPVLPELPPSETPKERAQLPVAAKSPEPAPPPSPTAWRDRLLESLASTRPRPPKLATGPLAPSAATLGRVADADPALHDDQTERRLMEDFGPFMRRGLEALRGHWKPGEVLDRTERDPSRRCGRQARTTFAVAVLDKQGNVIDVHLRGASGCPDLDKEAIAAFKRVGRFPHPPAGIFMGPDGVERETARYPVRFMVTMDGGLKLDWRT